MIESISISKEATFPDDEQTLGGLTKINFIYGANGSGKTTISRIIADYYDYPSCSVVWKSGNPIQAVVYNRDFVERNFSVSPKLKGVFTLGEDAGDAVAKIEQAKKEQGELEKKIENLNTQLNGSDAAFGKATQISQLEITLQEKCWKKFKLYDAKLNEAFTGVRNSAEKFKNKILVELDSNTESIVALDELEKRADTVFGDAPVTIDLIPEIDCANLLGHEANIVLGKRVIGKSDVDIAEMIKRLGNSDWVREGRSFYEVNDGSCPFCQQKTEDGFAKSLGEYFDESFEADSLAINDLLVNYRDDAARISRAVADIISAPPKFLEIEKFGLEKELLDSKVEINIQKLEQKKKEPSQIVELESLKNIMDVIGGLIKAANDEIQKHNTLVSNIGSEKRTLTALVWRFMLEELKDDLSIYKESKDKLTREISSIQSALNTAQENKLAKILEIQNLEKSVTSIQPTLDAINKLLSQFGFYSFTLAKADDDISYKLVRSDGKDAKETLSEGEKTFVTFLYFYYLLKGSNTSDGITTDRIVVFDDPVSSLDSDILFIVSSLIRRILDETARNVGYIKQVFVLTHNVYFHKEISYPPKDRRGYTPTYWVIKKAGAESFVNQHMKNPITTSYEIMWSDIRQPNPSNTTIQNTLRRILEHYFKILGCTDFDDIINQFDGNDKFVCKSLFSWIHAGSHDVLDDLHISHGGITIDSYLSIFRKIFENQGHESHYKMMMREHYVANDSDVDQGAAVSV